MKLKLVSLSIFAASLGVSTLAFAEDATITIINLTGSELLFKTADGCKVKIKKGQTLSNQRGCLIQTEGFGHHDYVKGVDVLFWEPKSGEFVWCGSAEGGQIPYKSNGIFEYTVKTCNEASGLNYTLKKPS